MSKGHKFAKILADTREATLWSIRKELVRKFKNIQMYEAGPLQAAVGKAHDMAYRNEAHQVEQSFKAVIAGNRDKVETVLLGKGILYDTGGLNLKTSHMECMFTDKSGAAAVLGHIMDHPSSKVAGIVGFSVNAIGPQGTKPGEVVTSSQGVRVEITDTDAEGRLLLADLIEDAQVIFPNLKHIVTIATLTGAVSYALGDGTYAGLMSTKDKVLQEALRVANDVKLWPLPHEHSYWRSKLKSSYKKADVANLPLSRAYGGSSMGGAFLNHFVTKKGVSFTHLDIANMSDVSGNATGFGIEQLQFVVKTLRK